MFFYMLVSYAEWERAVIKERTFSGKLRRAQEGKNPGFKPPYGYGEGFAVLPAEATVVRRIFELYRRGAGMIAITYRLNEEGIRFRGDRLWNESTVKKMLANPIYCGDLHYGRRSRNPARGKRKDEPYFLHNEEPSVVREDAVAAIISREEWNGAQATRAARPGARKGTSGRAFSSSHLLTGFARCVCGHAVIGYKGGGSKDFYYRCSGQRKKGNQACRCGYIRQDLVNEIVLSKLQREFGDRMAQERFAAQTRQDHERALGQAREGLSEARRAMERLESAEARIRKLFRDDELTLPEYREQRADIEREGESLRERVKVFESLVRGTLATIATQAEESEMAEQVQDVRKLDVEHQKALLRHFMQAITLYRQQGSDEVTCDVQWRWEGAGRVCERHDVAVTGVE